MFKRYTRSVFDLYLASAYGGDNSGLPSYGLEFISHGGDPDIIGGLATAYDLLDAHWQSVLFTSPETPKSTSDIYDIVVADVLANVQGGQVYYSEARDLVVIYSVVPTGVAEYALWGYLFDTVV